MPHEDAAEDVEAVRPALLLVVRLAEVGAQPHLGPAMGGIARPLQQAAEVRVRSERHRLHVDAWLGLGLVLVRVRVRIRVS